MKSTVGKPKIQPKENTPMKTAQEYITEARERLFVIEESSSLKVGDKVVIMEPNGRGGTYDSSKGVILSIDGDWALVKEKDGNRFDHPLKDLRKE